MSDIWLWAREECSGNWKRILCRFFGHRFEKRHHETYSEYQCQRCGCFQKVGVTT